METDPAAKSAGDRTPVKYGLVEGGQLSRGSVTTVSERAGERERERGAAVSNGGDRTPVKQRREGDDWRANERRRWFRMEVGERERERERESCVGGEMKIPIPSNHFSIPKEKKKKKQKIIKNHFPR